MTYEKFYDWVLTDIGLDLKSYKQTQLTRRIESLMVRVGVDNIRDYKNLLCESEKEKNKFIDFITINVTEFFRNPELFEELESYLKRGLFKDGKNLKIWSAACSLGCEPYSIAMILKENNIKKFSILATDIDNKILLKAREGIYTENEVKNINSKYKKYFKKISNNYILSDEIKAMVNFKKSDLILDKYEKNFDLILCRNVVIYLNSDAKHKIYKRFQESLNKDSLLFVGATESIYNAEKFGLLKLSTFIYKKI